MGFNIERADKPFVVKSPYKPSGDQPQAIAELAERIENGENDVVLMGATGTGKTATTAWLIEKLQRPTLIIEPNKTLAAQLCAEFRELMPDNAVSYFVSYYDYYQPEAYIPQTDTYIEKDSNINDDVERLRHAATANLLTRRDCVVVATVSCIYGLGTPEEYAGRMLFLQEGQQIDRDDLLRKFVDMQYKRNDIAFTRGTFRVRGDTVEIIPVYEELAIRIEFFGDEIDRQPRQGTGGQSLHAESSQRQGVLRPLRRQPAPAEKHPQEVRRCVLLPLSEPEPNQQGCLPRRDHPRGCVAGYVGRYASGLA